MKKNHFEIMIVAGVVGYFLTRILFFEYKVVLYSFTAFTTLAWIGRMFFVFKDYRNRKISS